MVSQVALLNTLTLTWSSTISEIRNAVWAAMSAGDAEKIYIVDSTYLNYRYAYDEFGICSNVGWKCC